MNDKDKLNSEYYKLLQERVEQIANTDLSISERFERVIAIQKEIADRALKIAEQFRRKVDYQTETMHEMNDEIVKLREQLNGAIKIVQSDGRLDNISREKLLEALRVNKKNLGENKREV